jgi:hypothetical protein
LAEHAELRQALELQTVPDYSTLFRFMLRVQEQVIAQVLAEVVRRFQSRKPAPDKAKSTVAVRGWLLEPSARFSFVDYISTSTPPTSSAAPKRDTPD